LAQYLYALTFPHINQFSKLCHSQNQEKICNNTIIITKDLTTTLVWKFFHHTPQTPTFLSTQKSTSGVKCPTLMVTKFFIHKQNVRKTLTKCQWRQPWRHWAHAEKSASKI